MKKSATLSLILLPLLLATLSGCSQMVEQSSALEPPSVVGNDVESIVTAPLETEQKPLESYPPASLAMPAEDMWEQIRRGYQLDRHEHERIQTHLRWFSRHQEYIDRVSERATPYLHLVSEEIEQRGLPSELALLPIIESAYRPYAYSHGRASGLWQIVPGTGKRFGLKQNWWYDGRRDVLASTEAALKYLSYLHRLFDGDWLHALAAYNSGEGTVRKAIRRNQKAGKPTDFWSLDLPRETRAYVPRLLAIARVVADPQAYGLTLPPIANRAVLATVETGSQIDLNLAAELSGVEPEELARYNPAFNRWATDPDGPHELLVPIERVEPFRSALAKRPDSDRVTWQTHTIRPGETLSEIAQNYNTSSRLIRRVNKLRGNLIRAGKQLLIPMARNDLDSYSMSVAQRRKAAQEKVHGERRIEYKVRSGDSFSTIAYRHKVGIRELARWNGMAPRDTLRVGTLLVIWQEGEVSRPFTSLPPSARQSNQQLQQKIAYRVRKGDSLARISERFRVSIGDLQRWNNLNSKHYLQPGQNLTLYVDLARQQGSI